MNYTTAYRVYRLTNRVTGKMYIGLTKGTLRARLRGHLDHAYESHRQGALQHSIRKHGIHNFTMTLLYEAVDACEARMVERGLIAQYGTMVPNGYNMTTGGEQEVGHECSPETRAKLRENGKRNVTAQFIAMAGNSRGKPKPPGHGEKQSLRQKGKPQPWNVGHPVSEETRSKISAKMKLAHAEGRLKPRPVGIPHSDSTKEKMRAAAVRRFSNPVFIEKFRARAATTRKVTDHEVLAIARLARGGEVLQAEIASMFNVSISFVSNVKTGAQRRIRKLETVQ